MDDSLASLRAMVALAERGSFSAAARELRLTRSAISKAIARLEQRHGVRLVERSTRSIQLTDAGAALAVQGRRALDALAASEDILSDATGEPSGRVRIDLPPAFGRHWVMPVLFQLQHRYTRLQFELGFSSRASELVSDGVDMAVRIGRLDDRAELVARRLGIQPTALYAAPRYLRAAAALHAADDLVGHACIVQDPRERWAWLQMALPLQPRLVLADSTALLQAAIAGQGIAWLPVWMASNAVSDGALVPVLAHVHAPVLPIHALWPQGRYLSRRVRLVIDALVAALAAEPAFNGG